MDYFALPFFAHHVGICEIQGTAEGEPFSEEEFLALLKLAKAGVSDLVKLQKEVISK